MFLGNGRVEDCKINIKSYTQDQAPVKCRVWAEFTFGDIKVVHPIYIVDLEKEQLIGQDLLNRLATLMDNHKCQLWTQVRTPQPIKSSITSQNLYKAVEVGRVPDTEQSVVSNPHFPKESLDPELMQAVKTQSTEALQKNWPPTQVLEKRDAFLCALEPCNAEVYFPQVVGGIQVNNMDVKDTVVALLSEKSAISKQLYQLLLERPGMAPLIEKK
ncbi:hypothetical protein DPX16_8412 [Anabarilius grahami]|uniref:Uncharacterized protein n=1 Tax=Anabarilius grahami TaxID=495550 RepID=A0A3N0Z2U8_ANAGA|nr:hypothetical protein DPX16_8412 [Anabarilius grahami]